MAHPLHPALVHFPIACWVLALPCDLVALWAGDPAWAQRAYELIAAGLVLALPAAVAGLIDFGKLTDRPAATVTAYRHLALVGSAWTLYATSWALRFSATEDGTDLPGAWAVGLACMGLILLIAGAWHGASLVYEHGVGRKHN